MTVIQWDDSYSVKNTTIDEQHKKLFMLINEFNKNVELNSSNGSISKLLEGLKEYIVFHFKTEEMYLRLYNYPHFESHKQEHERFIKKVADLEERYNEGNIPQLSEITAFFNAWINFHIKESDMEYADFLAKKSED